MPTPAPILIAAGGIVCAALMNASMKWLSTEDAVLVLTAWRYFFGALIASTGFLFLKPTWPGIGALPFHTIRGAIQLFSAYAFFLSLTHIALAEATTLAFTSALMIAPVAWVILGERMTLYTAGAAVAGFIGAALAVSGGPEGGPEGGNRLFGIACAFAAAFTYAISLVLLRWRSRSEDTATLAMFTNILPAILMLPVLVFMAPTPETERLPFYAMTGVFGVGIWTLMTIAYARAPAAQLAPVEYTSLIWAALIGWSLFGEIPGWQLWLGAVIIIAACLAVAFEDRFKTRRETHLPASDVMN